MDIAYILSQKYPDALWRLDSNDYETLVWEAEIEKPSIEELSDHWESLRTQQQFELLRHERNRKLFESDWTQVEDCTVDKNKWAEYRRELRDLPANTIDPFNPIWPVPPE